VVILERGRSQRDRQDDAIAEGLRVTRLRSFGFRAGKNIQREIEERRLENCEEQEKRPGGSRERPGLGMLCFGLNYLTFRKTMAKV